MLRLRIGVVLRLGWVEVGMCWGLGVGEELGSEAKQQTEVDKVGIGDRINKGGGGASR